MERFSFMETQRIIFSHWNSEDLPLARLLWGDPQVTRYICARGYFLNEEIEARLALEIQNQQNHQLQYWPIFHKESGELIGCCGLRPHSEGGLELGFHLRPAFWRQGYAIEAASQVIRYAFDSLKIEKLFAGHNPNNIASRRVLEKLGFHFISEEFYEPTGLYHPSYELTNNINEG